ncbi:MAG TPA: hypothetical protein ENN06_04565 [Desulfobacteraceae bacterium]|nr:hypothetical protein [Desulfobacteraceae bacterium]
MDVNASTRAAALIMEEFAEGTGLAPEGRQPRRYLWTDAFAVCNYLALHQGTGDRRYLNLARQLIDQVHFVLGRHRDDDPRSGWISGLSDEEGRLHPTAGGLRIGKKMGERGESEPFDERLEWERDGQYYHYLTKWMHALCRTATVTGEAGYLVWAAELARGTHRGFCHTAADGRRRLRWKMSIDLSRPLVPSMGHHDPLDGLLTCCEIRALARKHPGAENIFLDAEIAELAEMCSGGNWATTDPLGLGGLLADAWRLAQLLSFPASVPLPDLPGTMLEASFFGLSLSARGDLLRMEAAHRLAFRELGLAIGLLALPRLERLLSAKREVFDDSARLAALLAELMSYCPLAEQITRFWLREENRATGNWADHRDINMVMLVTSLVPDGFLDLATAEPLPGAGG